MTDVKLTTITDDRQKKIDAWRSREESTLFLNSVRALRAEAASLAMKGALENPLLLIKANGQPGPQAATHACQAARLEIFLQVWDELIREPLKQGTATIV